MTVFEADIIHYYAFYFLFGVLLLPLGSRALAGVAAGLNALFVALVLVLDYDAGWNWAELTYSGLWTPAGFTRNLFFNGWHPVVPWLGFLLCGITLSRLALARRSTQLRLAVAGGAGLVAAELLSTGLTGPLAAIDPELAAFAATSMIPPMPLYALAGIGAACLVVGGCLLAAGFLKRVGVLDLLAPAGRQTLTLYIAHILLGMGTIEWLGVTGGQTTGRALAAALLFCLAAAVYAYLWSRLVGRGPVEALMRRVAG